MPRAGGFLLAGAIVLLVLGCGRNPVLGDWEIDRDASRRGAVLAAEAMELTHLTFRSDAIVAGETEIPVRWVVEAAQVRAVRDDGRGEHRIEVLSEHRIRVELPSGVAAVYLQAES